MTLTVYGRLITGKVTKKPQYVSVGRVICKTGMTLTVYGRLITGKLTKKARYVSVGRVICRDGCSRIVTTRHISSFSLRDKHFTT